MKLKKVMRVDEKTKINILLTTKLRSMDMISRIWFKYFNLKLYFTVLWNLHEPVSRKELHWRVMGVWIEEGNYDKIKINERLFGIKVKDVIVTKD